MEIEMLACNVGDDSTRESERGGSGCFVTERVAGSLQNDHIHIILIASVQKGIKIFDFGSRLSLKGLSLCPDPSSILMVERRAHLTFDALSIL